LALFHLQSSARPGGEAAVGARGLTGPAYAGHVFWDTDVFVSPVLAAVGPASARAVLQYRLRRLGVARARAAVEGRRGARFPWESAHDGTDVTPTSGIDQHGEIVAIRTGALEEHVTADVAWAAWTYAAWTGAWAFLEGPGRPLLTETARYWASRVSLDEGGRAHIDGVIGPDEYHEGVDDNAFTNVMARWNLRRAAELAERRGAGGEEAEEAEAWRCTAERLVDGYDPVSGVYEQFAGYHRLAPLAAADLGRVPLAADLVLGAERLAASQVVKQADVLMAYHLVPDQLEAGSLQANVEYYLPRTAHGSSLSPSVHAAVLARAGRAEEALGMLRLAAAIDMEDLTETTAGGLHLANLGGMWQAIVLGFAGLRVASPDDAALVIDPVLPGSWTELRLRLSWRRRRVRLACRHDAVFVGCDKPLRVMVHGSPARVEPPGRWVE
ncbi:MAG TPA: glycosyl hydrolase family 65 protein, partial [Acidimicrobiales bacterium]|nr:glycosyl hydrolase family 65 protein [Acidimicrobiales bacterium]